jgi:DNA-binding beta-propeller fold protein YncE
MRTVLLLGCGLAAACTASASEVEPPRDQLFFPTGMAVAPGDAFLFVTNANSELRYDSGSVDVVDLAAVDQVVAGWLGPNMTIPSPNQDKGCYQDTDHRETLVCDESMFLLPDAGARIGNFATSVAVQDFGNGQLRLIVPTRGDPSFAFIDFDGTRLSCNTNTAGFALCDEAHRLSYVHNDQNLALLPDEPFDVYADSTANFAMITHLSTGFVTLVDSQPGQDAIIADVEGGYFEPDPTTGLLGSTGIAGHQPGPIVYVGSRSDNRIQTLSVGTPANYGNGDVDHSRYIVPGPYFFLDFVGQLAGGSTDTRGLTFNSTGDRLYLLNRRPPSLQIYDTSPDITGTPKNLGIGTTDICTEASTVTVLDAGDGDRAYLSCFQSGELYIVDPRGTGSVEAITPVGRGPYQVAAAPSRNRVYVSNFLDDTIAVVDVSPTSPTRDRVVLRIGTPRGR